MTLNEVSPPGWGHTKAEKEKTKPNKPKSKIGGSAAAFKRALDDGRFKGLPGSTTKKEKTADMFKLMWSMKKKGDKPHYKPGTDEKKKKYQKEGTSMPYVNTDDKKAINKRAKNLFKKDLKGTHDSVNEASGGGVPLTPQELEIQKKMARLNVRLARKRSQALAGAKTKDTETAPEQVKEGSLRKWFKGSKSKDGKGGWVNVVTGGTCASDEPGEGTPKCVSSAKRASMTKAERLSASRRKKAADPGQQSKSGAAKPTYVRTDSKKKMKEETSMQDNNLFGNAFAYEKLKKKVGSKKKHDKPAMESVISMIGRRKKKVEKKPEKAMDAGARARRALKRREHAQYVSDIMPKELEDQVQYEDRDLKKIAKELDGASKMHKGQANRIRKHLKDMRNEAKDVKLETKKNCGCGQDPCVTFGKKKLTQAQKVDEACWKGYKAYGMKKKGKRMVPNCKPIGSVKEASAVLDANKKLETERKTKKDKAELAKLTHIYKGMKKGIYNSYEPEGESIDERTLSSYIPSDRQGEARRANLDYMKAQLKKKEDESTKNRGDLSKRDAGKMAKERLRTKKIMSMGEGKGYQPEIEHSKMGDAKKKADKKRESKLPPHLQGDAIGKMKKAFATEEDKKGKGSGTKDACYHKVKASAKVWPSAYASGRLVQCRKKGAANYGKSKSEGFEGWADKAILEKTAAWTRKEGKNKEGGLNEKGRKSYEKANPGSDLKAPQPEGGSRKKSFCARMGGMKKKLTSAKTANDPDSRINKALRKWKC